MCVNTQQLDRPIHSFPVSKTGGMALILEFRVKFYISWKHYVSGSVCDDAGGHTA